MKEDGWIGKKGLRYWYYRYRDSEYYSMAMIGLTVVVGLFLLLGFIIPQFNEWFSIRQQVIESQERITVLQSNINFINNLDRGKLQTQLDTASSVLPPEKDFGSMLNILSTASTKANVSLSDYSFQVGNIASGSGVQVHSTLPGLDTNRITIVVVGTLSNVERFIGTLEESAPLSEVVAIDGSGQNISITVQFYQKPYPNISIPDTQRLTNLSDEKNLLLQRLSNWNMPAAAQPASGGTTDSTVPLF